MFLWHKYKCIICLCLNLLYIVSYASFDINLVFVFRWFCSEYMQTYNSYLYIYHILVQTYHLYLDYFAMSMYKLIICTWYKQLYASFIFVWVYHIQITNVPFEINVSFVFGWFCNEYIQLHYLYLLEFIIYKYKYIIW